MWIESRFGHRDKMFWKCLLIRSFTTTDIKAGTKRKGSGAKWERTKFFKFGNKFELLLVTANIRGGTTDCLCPTERLKKINNKKHFSDQKETKSSHLYLNVLFSLFWAEREDKLRKISTTVLCSLYTLLTFPINKLKLQFDFPALWCASSNFFALQKITPQYVIKP